MSSLTLSSKQCAETLTLIFNAKNFKIVKINEDIVTQKYLKNELITKLYVMGFKPCPSWTFPHFWKTNHDEMSLYLTEVNSD